MEKALKLGLLNSFKGHYNLQLFADDAGTDDHLGENDQKPDESKDKKDNKKYSDDDVDKIINKKFAEWEKKQQKAVDEAKKLAEMNAQQKAEYERDQLKAELEALKEKDTLSEMTRTARKILNDDGINISDDLLALMVTKDAEKTKTALSSFSKMFKDAVQEGVKSALRGDAPKVGNVKTLTKEDIMKVKNRDERQRLIKENMKLFK